MRLSTLDATNTPSFLRCLHDEVPEDPRVIGLRRAWFETKRGEGLQARVMYDERDQLVGMGQYLPIEASHIKGAGLFAILCLWVHGYEHLVGNQQGQGYGRFMLEQIERDVRERGAKGLAAWGMDFPYWNPVSFYEHMGYERVDQDGPAVLVWKPFSPEAQPPAFHHAVQPPPRGTDRINLTVFYNGWCTGSCGEVVKARDAAAGLEEIVELTEYDTADPDTLQTWGISSGIFLDGEPHRPHEAPCTAETLREDILGIAHVRGIDSP